MIMWVSLCVSGPLKVLYDNIHESLYIFVCRIEAQVIIDVFFGLGYGSHLGYDIDGVVQLFLRATEQLATETELVVEGECTRQVLGTLACEFLFKSEGRFGLGG